MEKQKYYLTTNVQLPSEIKYCREEEEKMWEKLYNLVKK